MSENDNWRLPPDASFGHVTYEPGGTCGPRHQPDVQLVIILSGSARIRQEGRWHSLPAGHTSLMRQGLAEWYRFATDEETEHAWVGLQYAATPVDIDAVLAKLPFSIPTPRALLDLTNLGLAAREEIGTAGRRLRGSLGMAALLTYVRACPQREPGDFAPWPVAAAPPPVRRAIAHMASHLAEPLSIADLAQAAHVTEAHLSRLFRRHTSQPPMEKLWSLRVERGGELLRATGLSVTEVALSVGFASSQHFARRVKQQTGRTPSEIRRAHWEQHADQSAGVGVREMK